MVGEKLDRLASVVEARKIDKPANTPKEAENDLVGFLGKLLGLGCKVVTFVRSLVGVG